MGVQYFDDVIYLALKLASFNMSWVEFQRFIALAERALILPLLIQFLRALEVFLGLPLIRLYVDSINRRNDGWRYVGLCWRWRRRLQSHAWRLLFRNRVNVPATVEAIAIQAETA